MFEFEYVLCASGVLEDVQRPQEMYDVMFEFACDLRRFTVKRFNVGLRKRWMGEHWPNWVD